jgi:hypothetical protein
VVPVLGRSQAEAPEIDLGAERLAGTGEDDDLVLPVVGQIGEAVGEFVVAPAIGCCVAIKRTASSSSRYRFALTWASSAITWRARSASRRTSASMDRSIAFSTMLPSRRVSSSRV